MMMSDQGPVRTRFVGRVEVLRRRLVGAGDAQAAVEFGFILMVALFVLAVAVQFAAPEAAVRVMEEANFQGMRSTAINPAASQSAVPAYLAEHIDDAFRA